MDREKIANYPLSVEHPRGRSKAAFFSGLGFHIDRWQDFAEALIAHAARHEVTQVVETPHGPRYRVDGAIETPDGRISYIRSVWQVDSGSDYPRLITAHPARRENVQRE